MSDFNGEQPRLTLTEQAKRCMYKVFDEIRLAQHMPAQDGERKIALLGAGGFPLEAESLNSYFQEHGLGKPQIIAFDIDNRLQSGITSYFQDSGIDIDFEYHSADLSKPESLGDEEYDLIMVRRPDIHYWPSGWERVFTNGFTHLKPNGLFLATAHEEPGLRFEQEQLKKHGEIIANYRVPPVLVASPLFDERALLLARKL